MPLKVTDPDEKDRGQPGFSPSSAALGAGAVGGAAVVGAPTPRSPMTNRGRGVRRKLESRARIGGRVSLKTGDFAEISGGRGWRPKNDAYTARMAQAMKAGKVKQNRLVLDIYDDNVVQRDGAHRAHATAMLGNRIKVKAVRHKGEKAPRHITGVNAIRDEIVQGRHRARLKRLGRTGGLKPHELDALAAKYKAKPQGGRIARAASKASSSGVPRGTFKGASPYGIAGGAAILGASALTAHRMNRRADRVNKEYRNRMQRVADREAVIQDRLQRRAAGENIPLHPRKDQQLLRERVRRVLHGVKQAPKAAADVRAAAEAAQKTVQQIDPVRVERISQNVRASAGHLDAAANSRLAGGVATAAERGLPRAGKVGLAIGVPLAAAGSGAALARRRSTRLLAAAQKRQRRNVAITAGGAGVLGGVAARKRD